ETGVAHTLLPLPAQTVPPRPDCQTRCSERCRVHPARPAGTKKKGTTCWLFVLRVEYLRSLGLEPLPSFRSHANAFPGREPFEQLLLKTLLFQATHVIPDEPPDVITWRPVVCGPAALFDELL